MIPRDKRNHHFSASNLRPVFEKVKFDVRRSLEPFKDLDGHFDPLTALTKRFQTLSNGACVSRILSAGVETDYGREKAYCCVTQRYYRILNCVVNLLSSVKGNLLMASVVW